MNVAHKLSLTGKCVENLLLHEFSLTLQLFRHVTEGTCIEMTIQIGNIFILRSFIFKNSEYLNEFRDILNSGVLIQTDTHRIIIDLSEIYAILMEFSKDLVGCTEI